VALGLAVFSPQAKAASERALQDQAAEQASPAAAAA
jgi:hypothetical protein